MQVKFLSGASLLLLLLSHFLWHPQLPTQKENNPIWLATQKLATPVCHFVATLLWGQAIEDLHEGRKLEALEKSEFALQLTADSPAAWVFLCWQMAYNFSATESSAQRQWQWINWSIQVAEQGLQRLIDPEPLQIFLALIYVDRIKNSPELQRIYGKDYRMAAIEVLRGGAQTPLLQYFQKNILEQSK